MYSLNCHNCRLIPILVAFHRIAYIAETYSLILAISELNIEVICKPTAPARTRPGLFPSSFPYLLLTVAVADDVLVNSEDMERMAEELRAKISAKIRSWSGVADPTDEQEREVSGGLLPAVCITVLYVLTSILSSAVQFVHLLFIEVDQDGSGSIDKGEFRMMLRKLNLTYRCAAVPTQLLVLTPSSYFLFSTVLYTQRPPLQLAVPRRGQHRRGWLPGGGGARQLHVPRQRVPGGRPGRRPGSRRRGQRRRTTLFGCCRGWRNHHR